MCQSRPWRRTEEEPMEKKDIVVAVDIAKAVFDAAVFHEPKGRREAEALAEGLPSLLRADARGDGSHGGVRVGSLLGPEDRRSRPSSGLAPSAPGPPLCHS